MSRSLLNTALVLRIFIGWHFLHEGVMKIIQPGWTSMPYLMDSQGPAAFFFRWIARNHALLQVADVLNMVVLTAAGMLLILGLFEKPALIGVIGLLAFYYLSHPPFLNTVYAMPPEGNYLFVDKNLIELTAALLLFHIPTGRYIGLARFFRTHF
jgi:thiosulfate dehydrogenase [quinone] large subunit